MFNADPFDPVSHTVHVVAGFSGLAVGLIALLSRKGGTVHVFAGRAFVATMLAAAITSLIFLLTEFQAPARDAALLAIYAIGSGFLTLRPQARIVKVAMWALTALGIAALVILIQDGIRAIQIGSPAIIALTALGLIFAFLLVGDLNYYRRSRVDPRQRIRRHKSRMAWGVSIAIQAPLVTFNESLGVPFPVAFFAPFLLVPIIFGVFRTRVWRSIEQPD